MADYVTPVRQREVDIRVTETGLPVYTRFARQNVGENAPD